MGEDVTSWMGARGFGWLTWAVCWTVALGMEGELCLRVKLMGWKTVWMAKSHLSWLKASDRKAAEPVRAVDGGKDDGKCTMEG